MTGSSAAPSAVLTAIAGRVTAGARAAIDGPDGAGKTVFANRLADTLRTRGDTVVRISLDDFHHVREIRYRRGRDSPEGFWLDSFNYERFRTDVLTPFRPGGSRRYRPRGHDLTTDEVLTPPWQTATPDAILLVDGLFLHRDELAAEWDVSVFLTVPFTETARRMARRDGCSPDPSHPSLRRYVQAQRHYFAACNPQSRATVVIDNADFHAPRVIRPP